MFEAVEISRGNHRIGAKSAPVRGCLPAAARAVSAGGQVQAVYIDPPFMTGGDVHAPPPLRHVRLENGSPDA